MSEPIDNGGPAFPVPFEAFHQGATLLDYFAGQALSGMMLNTVEREGESTELAVRAYDQATAMVAEKRRRETTI